MQQWETIMTSNKIKPDAFNCFYCLIYLTAGLLTLLCFYLPADARQASGFFVPESFSNLAKSVSPAVVNIRTEKTIKDGGRAFRHFNRNPFGQDDPFQVRLLGMVIYDHIRNSIKRMSLSISLHWQYKPYASRSAVDQQIWIGGFFY